MKRNHSGGIALYLKDHWIDLVPYIMLLALLILSGIVNPNTFSVRWLSNKLDSGLILVLVSVGQMLVLLTGGFDLSVGGVICITNCLSAVYMQDSAGSILLWSLLCIAAGLAVGCINGLAVVLTGIQPFIITLSTQSICYGIALLILKIDGGTPPDAFISFFTKRIGAVPVSLIILVLIALLWGWFKQTKMGLNLYAVGSSEVSAKLAGARVDAVKVFAYALCGGFAGFAGLYRTAQVASGSPTAGASYVMLSIAAAVIGGTALSGGKGGLLGTIAGAFILRSIADLLVFWHISSYWTSFIQGLLLIAAVAIQAFGTLRKQRG